MCFIVVVCCDIGRLPVPGFELAKAGLQNVDLQIDQSHVDLGIDQSHCSFYTKSPPELSIIGQLQINVLKPAESQQSSR